MTMGMTTIIGESHPSASDRIAKAEEVAYLYVAPIILTAGLFGSAANLLVLSNKRRFDGRLYVYLRVREIGSKSETLATATCSTELEVLTIPAWNRLRSMFWSMFWDYDDSDSGSGSFPPWNRYQ